jgi:hypothetical protein
MVQIDVPVAFGIGSLFADAAAKQLRFGRPEYYYRAIWKHNIFQIFFFSWVPLYFLMNYFGWETTHMWWKADSIDAYPYFVPIFVVVFFGAANAGFLLGRRLVIRGHLVLNRFVYLGTGLYALIWTFAQTHRTFRLGTYAQFERGQSPLFYQDCTFLRMLVFTLVVWAGGIAVFAIGLWLEGKHLDYLEPAKSS